MTNLSSNRWALVLAGGDGSRLKSFTKKITGYELPKQFCPILSSKPLLRETLDRVSRIVAPSRTLISVNRAHRRFYAPMLQGAQLIVEEPRNRDTAPAILHALIRLYELAPSAIVAIFPSDHYIGNETRFAQYMDLAFGAADSDDVAVLLGAEATDPEQAYGWIEPEISQTLVNQHLFAVRRFVEKPGQLLASELWRSGALWNTFVLAARASTLLQMFVVTMPRLYAAFSDIRPMLQTVFEEEVLIRLYDGLPSSGFSEMVLQQYAADLMVMPMRGIQWCDLGEPGRVLKLAKSIGVRSQWAVA